MDDEWICFAVRDLVTLCFLAHIIREEIQSIVMSSERCFSYLQSSSQSDCNLCPFPMYGTKELHLH